jgi:hypothetical protein
MASIPETISSVQDKVLDLMKTVQEPVVGAVEKVVETVDGRLPEDRRTLPFTDSLPNPAEAIDKAFGAIEKLVDGQNDFVKAIVANQHEFAKAIVDALSPLLPAAKAAPVKSAKPAASKTTKAA